MRTSSNNSYCDFSENKTIEFLPEEWGLRWSILAFKVNMFIFLFLNPITKSYMLKKITFIVLSQIYDYIDNHIPS